MPHPNWSAAVDRLNEIDDVTLPHVKSTKLLQASNLIYSTFKEESHTNDSLSADDFLPVLIYCVVHSSVDQWLMVKALLVAFSANEGKGEESYYITCVEIAVEYILSLQIANSVILDSQRTLGIQFKQFHDSGRTIVDKITENSQAALSENIKIGDVLLSVNGCSVQTMSLADVTALIRKTNGPIELCFTDP